MSPDLAAAVTAIGAGLLAAFATAAVIDRWIVPARRPAPRPSTGVSASARWRPAQFGGALAASQHQRPAHPWRRRQRSRRHATPTPDEVAGWLDDVAAELRAGRSLRDSLIDSSRRVEVGQFRRRLDELVDGLERGDDVHGAIDRWRQHDDESIGVARATLLVTLAVGGSLAHPVERAAALLRRRAAEADERRGWSAQARLSAIVMSAVPVGILLLLLLVDGDVRDVATRPIGLGLILTGAALDAAGFWWMRRITARAAR